MAKTKISEFSSTPANNTDIDSINIAEGCAPSGINDAIRELMAQLKDFQTGAQGDSFNGPIGTSTAAAGAFTTLSATGAITSTLATGTAPLVIASTTKVSNLNVDLLDGADWAAPAALGSTTPAAVSATTLSASSTVTLSGGTANGVAYLNGSKVVTSGSALTFDGTNLSNTGRFIVNNAGSAAGVSDISLGSLSGGAWLNTPSGKPGYLAIAGGAAFYWDASNLISYINGSEQMRLTSTGLGIGTSSPQTKLHVAQSASGVLFGQDSTTANIIGTNAAGTSSQGLFLKGFPLTFTGSGGGGTAQMTLNGDGNLGLGVTPSGWNLGKAIEIGNIGNAVWAPANNQMVVSQGAYWNTNWKYGVSGVGVTYYDQFQGEHRWFTAPSGTAGNAITFTQAMTLDADGDLGIGTTSPSVRLNLSASNPTNGVLSLIQNISTSGQTGAKIQLDVANVGSSGIGIPDGSSNALSFFVGGMTSASERARIDSSGNFLVGTTSLISGTERFSLSSSASDWTQYTRNTNASPYGLRITYSDAAPNGTGNEFLYCSDNGPTLRASIRSNGGIANYAANNVILSDRREKTNFAPAKSYLAAICSIPVQTFNYIDQNLEEDGGLTLGVVAQDVQAVAPELVHEGNWGTKDEPKMRLEVYQTDLQYALMKCIQELKAEFDAYKASHP